MPCCPVLRHSLCRPFWVLMTLLLAIASQANEKPLSLDELVSLRSVSAVRMSPAGERIAYLLSVPRELYKDDDGRPWRELHVVDFDGTNTPYVTGKVDVSDLAWSADGEALYFLAKREADATFNSVYRIPVAGGEAQKVFTHVSNIAAIYPSPDGRTLAFTASDAPPAKEEELKKLGFKAIVYEESLPVTHVWLLDLASGSSAKQELPGHASAFAWSADSSRYAVALAPTPQVDDEYTARDIHVVDAKSGQVRSRIGSVGKLGHFALSPDGERIAYIGSVDIHDPSAGRLYLASSAGGERRDLVPDYAGHVSDFTWRDDLTIDWLGERGAWTEWESASVTGARAAGPPPGSGPILRALHGSATVGASAAIADTPRHPREVYLLQRGQAPQRLTFSNPALDERRLATQEVIRYKARDGLELEAILIRPFDARRGGNPLVLFVHGGPESHLSNGWLSTYSQPGQVLAASGYAVAYPNYRGSTGRGVEFSMLGQHASAAAEFDDLVDTKHYLVSQGIANPDKTGISGTSYGGYASMWAASVFSEEFAAAVAFVGISNHISMFTTGDIPNEFHNVHVRAWPWNDWQWMLERSPVYHAAATRTPLLILGGDADPRVHPSQSLEMYRMVKLQTDTPVRLVIYPGEVHGNRHTAAQYDYGLRLLRWMEHFLVGGSDALPDYELPHAERLTGDR